VTVDRPPAAKTPPLIVSSRFCGPPGTGNGGYVCGRIAAYTDGPVTVTLRQPPPLATPMAAEPDGNGSVRILLGHTLIAEAAPTPHGAPLRTPGTVSLAEARAVEGRASYFQDPFFPACFSCGVSRQPGDGLRIFPGPVSGGALWAAPWAPDPSVTGASGTVLPEVVWAALDCPSGIAAAEAAGVGRGTVILLGQMTASVAALPAAGDQCRLIAWLARRDGRKFTAGSALLGPGGEVLAAARTLWLTVRGPVPARAAEETP
jgi:hypothetical protein